MNFLPETAYRYIVRLVEGNRMQKIIAYMLLVLIGLTGTGCEQGPTNRTPLVYFEISPNWQKVTVQQIGQMFPGLPTPYYLPKGYQIQEVYFNELPESNPHVTQIYLIISDQPIVEQGGNVSARLVLNIDWHASGPGLKMPWAEPIPEVNGRLVNSDGQYDLWWEKFSSTLRLHSSNKFPKAELIKIASSINTGPD